MEITFLSKVYFELFETDAELIIFECDPDPEFDEMLKNKYPVLNIIRDTDERLRVTLKDIHSDENLDINTFSKKDHNLL